MLIGQHGAPLERKTIQVNKAINMVLLQSTSAASLTVFPALRRMNLQWQTIVKTDVRNR